MLHPCRYMKMSIYHPYIYMHYLKFTNRLITNEQQSTQLVKLNGQLAKVSPASALCLIALWQPQLNLYNSHIISLLVKIIKAAFPGETCWVLWECVAGDTWDDYRPVDLYRYTQFAMGQNLCARTRRSSIHTHVCVCISFGSCTRVPHARLHCISHAAMVALIASNFAR